MKIAKNFTWEMGHRLPFHNGKCVNLHGHSYKAIVELEGELDENGMLLDYYDLKQIVNPVIEPLDHAFMVFENDTPLLDVLNTMGTKKAVMPFQSTAENLAGYLARTIAAASALPENVSSITVTVYETEDSYASITVQR